MDCHGLPVNYFSRPTTPRANETQGQIYLNPVENTTSSYPYLNTSPDGIEGDQITAIDLSPNDPQFLPALNQPLALYPCHLTFTVSPWGRFSRICPAIPKAEERGAKIKSSSG